MSARSRPIVAALVGAAVSVSACGSSSSGGNGGADPATVEPVKGTDVNRVTLTVEAAERLGIETAPVRKRGAQRTFTYTSPTPRVFVRAPITVARIDGDEVILRRGPPVGTQVVTVGSQELYGSEYEVEEG